MFITLFLIIICLFISFSCQYADTLHVALQDLLTICRAEHKYLLPDTHHGIRSNNETARHAAVRFTGSGTHLRFILNAENK